MYRNVGDEIKLAICLFGYWQSKLRGQLHRSFFFSSCPKTQELVNAAKGIQTSQEFQNIISYTKTLVSDVGQKLKKQKANISRIAEEKQSVRKTIVESRTKISNYFDDLEKNSLDELDHRERIIVSRINKDINCLEIMKSKAEDILNKLDTFKGDNE